MAETRPFEDDLKVAKHVLNQHTNRVSVWFYRFCQWRMNNQATFQLFKDRPADFFEETRKLIWAGEEIPAVRKERDEALECTPLADRGSWVDPDYKFLSQTYRHIQGLVWYAISETGEGNMPQTAIAEKYGIDQSRISRIIKEVRKQVESPGIDYTGEVPQPLDYESPAAQAYYDTPEIKYYKDAKTNFDTRIDLTDPIVGTLVHQIIVNNYSVQCIQNTIRKRGSKGDNEFTGLFKRISDIQDQNKALYSQVIEIQKQMGKLENQAESISALKKRLEEVRASRNQDKELADEKRVDEMNRANNKYLGFQERDIKGCERYN